MQVNITDISSYAANLIQSSPSGFIHSVYQHTINIQTDKGLIALQSSGSVISPISLIAGLDLDTLGAYGISRGVPVHLAENFIQIMSPVFVTLSLEAPTYHTPFLSAHLEKSKTDLFSHRLFQVLSSSSDLGFRQILTSLPASNESASPIISMASQYLEDCSKYLSKKAYRPAAKAAIKLIGLGIGLTPSGDDFLCGVLAGLSLASLENHPFTNALKEEISSHLCDTNDISAAFLSCALKNMYSQPVLTLVSMKSPSKIGHEFSKIGHSSGMDTLCGIYYILTQRERLIG